MYTYPRMHNEVCRFIAHFSIVNMEGATASYYDALCEKTVEIDDTFVPMLVARSMKAYNHPKLSKSLVQALIWASDGGYFGLKIHKISSRDAQACASLGLSVKDIPADLTIKYNPLNPSLGLSMSEIRWDKNASLTRSATADASKTDVDVTVAEDK